MKENTMKEYRLHIDKAAKPLLIIDYTFLGDRCLDLMKSTDLPSVLQLSLIHISEPTRPY